MSTRPPRPAPDAAVAIRYDAEAVARLDLSRILLAQANAIAEQTDLDSDSGDTRRAIWQALCKAADRAEADADRCREIAHDARTIQSVSA